MRTLYHQQAFLPRARHGPSIDRLQRVCSRRAPNSGDEFTDIEQGQREQKKLGIGKESIEPQSKQLQPQKSSKRAKIHTPRISKSKACPTESETSPISRANHATPIEYGPAPANHTKHRTSATIHNPYLSKTSPSTYQPQPQSAAPNDLFSNPEFPTGDANFERLTGVPGDYCDGLNSTEGVCKDPLFCIKVHKCLACHRKGHGHLHCHKMAHVSSFMPKQ